MGERSTAEVLRRRGVEVSDAELAGLLDEALGGAAFGLVDDPATALPESEASALAAGGVDLRARQPGEAVAGTEAAVAYGALLAAALTVRQAAERLGIDTSRVRHRLADRSLYGIRLRSGWRLPAGQFAGRGTVPGLDRVLPAVPHDLHPVAVWRWLAEPIDDLSGDGDRLSPLQWLASGRDPAVVATLAADL